MDPPTAEDQKQKFIRNVFLKYRVQKIGKRWLKLSKKSKQRFYKLKEWAQTEESYFNRLIVLRDKVRAPLKEHELISEYEQQLIFVNLDPMIQLSMEMKDNIDKILATWDPINTILAPTVENLSIYLRLYKEYSNNFQKADKMIQALKNHPKFKEVVKVDYIEDYLIKPVQRPLQYKLFVTDYLRALPPYHKDYQNLDKSLKILLKVANEINEFVESQIRAAKMYELEKVFTNVIESSRYFKFQFDASTLEHRCRIYVCNDLLLGSKIISEQKEEPFLRMHLCGGSYVVKQEDNKTFKNRLYICGTQKSIHLILPSQADLQHNFQMLEEFINELYQKQYNREELISKVKFKRETMVMNRHSSHQEYKWKEQPHYRMRIKIEVVGVDKRKYDNQWKIVYAVKYQLEKPENIYQIAYYEVDELREIEKYINCVHPNLKLPSIDIRYKGMNPEDVKINFTKYSQYRAAIIQDFLNSILRCPELSAKPELIAYKLRIHESLWDYLNKISVEYAPSECGCEACLHNEIYTGFDFYEKQKLSIRKKRFQFCILKAFYTQNSISELVDSNTFKKLNIEEKMTWLTCKQKRIDYGVLLPDAFGKNLTFAVDLHLTSEDTSIIVKDATINSTCRQIVEDICEKRGIKTTRDLTLVFVNDTYQHYLDDDEYVVDYIRHTEDTEATKGDRSTRLSIFQGFSRNMDDLGSNAYEEKMSGKPKIYLRKKLTFPHPEEEKACQQNFERYPIMLGEMLKKFRDQELLLTISEMKVFCALFYSIEEFNTLIFSKKIFINEEKIKKFLPASKANFVNFDFLEEVRTIIENQVKLCDNATLLYRCILKQFGEKTGWITQYFPLENTDPSSLVGNNSHLLLGVNYKNVIVTRKYNLANLLEFPISKFAYRISGNTLFIESEQKTFQFVGNNLFTVHNMIQSYKMMDEFKRK